MGVRWSNDRTVARLLEFMVPREDAVHRDAPFAKAMTAAVDAEVDGLARRIGLGVRRCARAAPDRLSVTLPGRR